MDKSLRKLWFGWWTGRPGKLQAMGLRSQTWLRGWPELNVFSSPACVCAQSLSHARLSATPWTVALQAPLSIGSPRQEHWSGLPFPSPEDFHNPGDKPKPPALQVELYHWATRETHTLHGLVFDHIRIESIICTGNSSGSRGTAVTKTDAMLPLEAYILGWGANTKQSSQPSPVAQICPG